MKVQVAWSYSSVSTRIRKAVADTRLDEKCPCTAKAKVGGFDVRYRQINWVEITS